MQKEAHFKACKSLQLSYWFTTLINTRIPTFLETLKGNQCNPDSTDELYKSTDTLTNHRGIEGQCLYSLHPQCQGNLTHEFYSTKANCVAQRTKWKASIYNSQMSIRENLHDAEFGNDFLVLTVNTQETNEQTDCLDSMETYKSVNQRTESTEQQVTVSRDKAAGLYL